MMRLSTGQASSAAEMVIAWEPRATKTDPAILRDPKSLVELTPRGHVFPTHVVKDLDSYTAYDHGATTSHDTIQSVEWGRGYRKVDDNFLGLYGRGKEVNFEDFARRVGGFCLKQKSEIPQYWLEKAGDFLIYNPQNVKSLRMCVTVKMPVHEGYDSRTYPSGIYDREVLIGLGDAFKPKAELAHVA